MSNGIKRIGKGLFAIFMIKLSLVVGVLAFQACQTESNSYKEIAEVKNNFLDAIYESREQIKKISLKNSLTSGYDDTKVDFIAKENDEDFVNWKQICLGNIQQDSINAGTNSTTDLTNIDTTDINTVGDLFDLADGTGTRPIVVNNNDDLNDDDTDETPIISFDICFNIPTQPTLEALEPSIVAAKEYFYSKQFSDDEILEILDGEDESNLVPLVMALVAEEEQSNNSNVSMNYLTLFGTSSYAQGEGPNLYDCALRSLGITALTDAFSNGLNSSLGKKALKKAIKKIALRTLGWVGAAWAAYEFGGCMNWW